MLMISILLIMMIIMVVDMREMHINHKKCKCGLIMVVIRIIFKSSSCLTGVQFGIIILTSFEKKTIAFKNKNVNMFICGWVIIVRGRAA